jgi:hypothetical protein
MRRAAIALPVIATVPSGAALAQSSSLMRVSQEPWIDTTSQTGLMSSESSTTGSVGSAYCLDTTGLDYDPLAGTVDLGTSTPHVTSITNREYFKDAEATTPASISEMCTEGGEYYYVDGTTSQTLTTGSHGHGPTKKTTSTVSTTKVSLPQGAFTSVSAMTSFASNITINQI